MSYWVALQTPRKRRLILGGTHDPIYPVFLHLPNSGLLPRLAAILHLLKGKICVAALGVVCTHENSSAASLVLSTAMMGGGGTFKRWGLRPGNWTIVSSVLRREYRAHMGHREEGCCERTPP